MKEVTYGIPRLNFSIFHDKVGQAVRNLLTYLGLLCKMRANRRLFNKSERGDSNLTVTLGSSGKGGAYVKW